MARHRGQRSSDHGTDAGKPYEEMTAEERGAEFDASFQAPVAYGRRNFGSAPEAPVTRRIRSGG